MKYIGCGELNSLYLYILYSILAKWFANFIFEIPNTKYGLFYIKPILSKYTLIKSLYKYLSFIIFSIIVFYYKDEKTDNEKNNESQSKTQNISKDTKKATLIYKKQSLLLNVSISEFLKVCFIYVFFLEIIKITYSIGLHDLDLWMFNIVFTSLFIKYFYKKKTYNHQAYSLGLNFFVNLIISIIPIFLDFFDSEKDKGVIKLTGKLFNNPYLCIVVIILYILNSVFISYSRVLGKTLMELKYLSPYKIILYIGIFGFIFISIFLILSSIYTHKKKIDTFCDLKNIPEIKFLFNDNCTYFDSIPLYFYELKGTFKNNTIAFWVETIVIIPLNLLANFLEFNFEILLIYYLNPIYILVSDSIYYGIIALIKYIFEEEKGKIHNILKVISDIVAFLCYLVYLEIIELRFCRLNENIRKEIIRRSKLDTQLDLEVFEPIMDEDDKE